MFVLSTLVGDLLAFLLTISVLIVVYFKWQYKYWERRGVPYLPPQFPTGHLRRQGDYLGMRLKDIYDQTKLLGWKHTGIFFYISPSYLPLDLEYIRNILSKDFPYFVDRGLYYNEKDDPLTGHLFLLGGKKWRNLRTKLTPTFTSGKMKMMFGTLAACEKYLNEKVKQLEEKGDPIDIKDVLGGFTTDVISSCAFGLDCKATQSENSPFQMHLKKFFSAPRNLFKRVLLSTNKDLAKALHIRSIDKDISDFFLNVVKDTVEYREKNQETRKDFLQLLIELKDNFTIEEIAAQSFVFFLAGFETSSTTMAYALYELARHPEIQTKARAEIHEVLRKYNGNLTYEAIQDLKYLGQIIDETLRMYPPLSFITRECVQDYKIPDEEVTIAKGTRVFIPILAVHRDPQYWPDPDKFDPERFNEVNKPNHRNYSYMPFGEGPRLCIGMRFGIVQSKVGLLSILRDYEVTVNKKTKEPLSYKKRAFILTAEGEIWLDVKKM